MMTLTPPDNYSPIFEIVSCFCEYDSKFILLKRQDHKYAPNTYGVPAGKKDPGETILEAMKREILEETGIKITDENLSYFKLVYLRHPTFDYDYHIYVYRFNQKPEIFLNPEEHKDFAWVTPEESLQMNLIGGLDECIREYYKI